LVGSTSEGYDSNERVKKGQCITEVNSFNEYEWMHGWTDGSINQYQTNKQTMQCNPIQSKYGSPLGSLLSSGSNPEPAVNLSHGMFHSQLKTYLFSSSLVPRSPMG